MSPNPIGHDLEGFDPARCRNRPGAARIGLVHLVIKIDRQIDLARLKIGHHALGIIERPGPTVAPFDRPQRQQVNPLGRSARRGLKDAVSRTRSQVATAPALKALCPSRKRG